MGDMQEEIRWKISVSIFKNTIILKQLGIAVGIPFGLVILVIVFMSGKSRDALYALGFVAALFIFSWFFIMVAYRGKYQVEFVLNQKGVLCRTQAGQTKKNQVINTLTVILGLLSGKPAVAGAGMLAQSRQVVFLPWNRITRVKYKPKSYSVLLCGGWMEQIVLFCTHEYYPLVEELINDKTKTK